MPVSLTAAFPVAVQFYGLYCTDNSFTYQLLYFDTLYYIFMFVLPLLLLTVFNTRLIIVYQRFRRKRVALHGFSGCSTTE